MLATVYRCVDGEMVLSRGAVVGYYYYYYCSMYRLRYACQDPLTTDCYSCPVHLLKTRRHGLMQTFALPSRFLAPCDTKQPPCTVLFCGGTDWTALGRRPTEGDVLCPKRLLSFPKRIKFVASGPTACHSVCIDVHGGVNVPPCFFVVCRFASAPFL